MDGRPRDLVAKAKALSVLGSMALVALVIEAWPHRSAPVLPARREAMPALAVAPPHALVLPGRILALPDAPRKVTGVERPVPPARASRHAPLPALASVTTLPGTSFVSAGPLDLVDRRQHLPPLPPHPPTAADASGAVATVGSARPGSPAGALTRGVTATGGAIRTAFKITGKSIAGAFARAF